MKRFAFFFLAASVSIAAAQVSTRSAIEKQIAAYDRAVMSKNIVAMKAVMTPDFIALAKSGQKIDVASTLGKMRSLLQKAKTVKTKTKITKFEQRTSTIAHLQCANVFDLTFAGQQGGDIKFHSASTTDEYWVRGKDGAWKLKRSKTLTDKATLNGKPLG